jgi:Uncharacterised nucleotidyltransferase
MSDVPQGPRPYELRRAALMLRLDEVGAAVVDDFAARGIPSIVLKGPVLRDWLYADDELRSYGDIDVLVPPDRFADAQRALEDQGFEDALAAMAHPGMESEASYAYKRGRDAIDLHARLFGLGADSRHVWEVLWERTEPYTLAGREVRVLSEGARAFHVALHASQHGRETEQTLLDLQRALEVADASAWQEAATVARELDAEATLLTGLRLVPEGEALADRLGLQADGSAKAALRVSGVPMAEAMEDLSQVTGIGGKLRFLLHEAFPTPAFLRWWSPLARRGPAGLVLAYPWRWSYLATHAPRALLTWRRARRSSR